MLNLLPLTAVRAVLQRWLKFNLVGVSGTVVQTIILALLVRLLGVHYLLATVLAVEVAVLHNFIWHRRWTWTDRPRGDRGQTAMLMVRYHLTIGLLSILGNVVFTRLLVDRAGLNFVAANLGAIAACSLFNFLVADRYLFS